MAIAFFDSLDDCDSVDVEFVSPDGLSIAKRLLVDSGFTGENCFVLSSAMNSFALATVAASRASGALRGSQSRILLPCRIPALSFERNLIAITTDVSPHSLPPGIDGMAGLSFLRQFPRWARNRRQKSMTGDFTYRTAMSNGGSIRIRRVSQPRQRGQGGDAGVGPAAEGGWAVDLAKKNNSEWMIQARRFDPAAKRARAFRERLAVVGRGSEPGRLRLRMGHPRTTHRTLP